MVTHPRYVLVVLLGGALLASGCGSAKNSAGTASNSSGAAAGDSSAYRAAVNAVFDPIVAARGDYEAGQGAAELRSAAQSIQDADEQGLAQLRALHAPASATALQAQLAAAIAGQARAVRAVLAPDKLDTARLGDAVRLSNEMEQIVNQINALP
jgi:hypothetical protein